MGGFDGDPADIAVLVAKPFENPLRGVPLLSRPTFIRRQYPVDDPGIRIQLRTRRRSAPPVSGWDRKRQHLGYCPRVNAKLPRRFPSAQTLDLYRVTLRTTCWRGGCGIARCSCRCGTILVMRRWILVRLWRRSPGSSARSTSLRWTCRTATRVLCRPIRRRPPKRSVTGTTPRSSSSARCRARFLPDYVPGNIIGVLCPPRLCGEFAANSDFPHRPRWRWHIAREQ